MIVNLMPTDTEVRHFGSAALLGSIYGEVISSAKLYPKY